MRDTQFVKMKKTMKPAALSADGSCDVGLRRERIEAGCNQNQWSTMFQDSLAFMA